MRCLFISLLSLLTSFALKAQQVESIYFNLYTDSLKKGTYNYINVDGKTTDGQWLPLTSKEIDFSASACRFEKNSLFVEKDFSGESVTITAVLKSKPDVRKSVTIYIKKMENNEPLKTSEEIMREPAKSRKKRT